MIEVDSKQFTRALKFAGQVIDRHTKVRVISGLKITANGALRLSGTDLDTFVSASIPYSGDETELHMLAPDRVRGALEAVGSETVALVPVNQDKLVVRSGSFKSTLSCVEFDDFPGDGAVHFEEFACDLGAAELRQIARVVPAISVEETRYYLNGICVTKVGEWDYRFTATDGHRLFTVDIPLPGAQGSLADRAILPKRWINLVLSSFTRSRDPVRLSYGKVAFRNDRGPTLELEPGRHAISMTGVRDDVGLSISSKLIDGHYPDTDRVVPAAFQHTARVVRRELQRAVRALTPMHVNKLRAVKLRFERDALICQLDCPDLGESRISIQCEHNAPDGYVIGINGEYLSSACNALAGEELQLSLNGSGDPLRIVDPADTAFQAIIMPMRV